LKAKTERSGDALVGAGSDGVGGAVDKAIADVLGKWRGVGEFRELVEGFSMLAQADVDGLLGFATANAKMENVARFLLSDPMARTARDVAVIPANDLVAYLQPAFFSVAAWIDRSDRPGRIGFALEAEAGSS
jgi:hypothetical protein